MKKFENFIICSDYDGTLTKNGVHVTSALKEGIDNICKQSVDALKYFVAEGGRFIICSGRSPGRMKFLYDYLPIDDIFAGINGTVLYSKSKDEVLYQHAMKIDFIDFVRDVMTAIDGIPEYHVVTEDMTVHLWDKDRGDAMSLLCSLKGTRALKVIFDSRDDLELMDRIEEYVRAKYGNALEINKSCPHFLECNDKGSGKGEVIKYLKKNNPTKTVIALGDFGNDQSMMEEADYAFCPENATPEIKAVSNKVLSEARYGFIADVVKEIEDNLCK